MSSTRYVEGATKLRVPGSERLALRRFTDGRAYATLERRISARRPCTSLGQTTRDPFQGRG